MPQTGRAACVASAQPMGAPKMPPAPAVPPPPPPPPSIADASIQGVGAAYQAVAARRRGMGSTILTSGQGLQPNTQFAGKSLLGM